MYWHRLSWVSICLKRYMWIGYTQFPKWTNPFFSHSAYTILCEKNTELSPLYKCSCVYDAVNFVQTHLLRDFMWKVSGKSDSRLESHVKTKHWITASYAHRKRARKTNKLCRGCVSGAQRTNTSPHKKKRSKCKCCAPHSQPQRKWFKTLQNIQSMLC